VLDSKRPADSAVIDAAPVVADYLSDDSAAHYRRVLGGLGALGISYTEAPRLVRGLDYYRRTTFEFAAESLDAAQNAVGGGGRYDGLAEELGGPPTDGIGFALGVDRILLACDAEGVFPGPPEEIDVYVVDLVSGDAAGSAARDLTHELRAAGFSADRRFGGGSMKSQMKSADRSGAHVALIVGDDEATAGEVTMKPLRGGVADERPPQRRVPRCDLLDELVRAGLRPAHQSDTDFPTRTPS
jgi:histidyl-tRNA synthetase